MRAIKTILLISMVALVVLSAGCTGNALDDGSSPDVILEVISFDNPSVTARVGRDGFCGASPATFCIDDSTCAALVAGDICEFECRLTPLEWSIGLANIPKNSVAAQPFNDIVMSDVFISYSWPTVAVAPVTVGLGGIAIPTDGATTITFIPILAQDLISSMENTTGNLSMIFSGQTLEGTPISLTVLRDLAVRECL